MYTAARKSAKAHAKMTAHVKAVLIAARRGAMPGDGKPWGRGSIWSEEEKQLVRDHPELSTSQLAILFPERTSQSVGNMRRRLDLTDEVPPVKPAGDYLEHLADYLVDEFDCMEIWAKWNGYASWRELSRTKAGWVTLVCTAK